MSAAHTAKKVVDVATKAAEAASHLHTLSALFGALKGKEPLASAPAVVQGLYGIFGFADERELEVLLYELEHENDMEGKKPREVLAGFFMWHFRNADTVDEQVLSWWYGNAFRTFLTKMGKSDGHKEGVEVTTVESKDATTGATAKTVTTKELHGHVSNNALNFLKMMVNTITSENSRVKGYRKLLKQFVAFGVPHIPGNAHGRASELKVQLESVATKCEAAATQSAAKPKSWLNRILRSI